MVFTLWHRVSEQSVQAAFGFSAKKPLGTLHRAGFRVLATYHVEMCSMHNSISQMSA